MQKRRILSALLLAVGFSGTAGAQSVGPLGEPKQAGDAVEDCASVTARAIVQTFGITHVVLLRNSCEQTVVCEVWTDVDPLPRQVVRADPGQSAEVITNRGSTETRVTAGSSCHFE